MLESECPGAGVGNVVGTASIGSGNVELWGTTSCSLTTEEKGSCLIQLLHVPVGESPARFCLTPVSTPTAAAAPSFAQALLLELDAFGME